MKPQDLPQLRSNFQVLEVAEGTQSIGSLEVVEVAAVAAVAPPLEVVEAVWPLGMHCTSPAQTKTMMVEEVD